MNKKFQTWMLKKYLQLKVQITRTNLELICSPKNDEQCVTTSISGVKFPLISSPLKSHRNAFLSFITCMPK